jgi:hypothetical protein
MSKPITIEIQFPEAIEKKLDTIIELLKEQKHTTCHCTTEVKAEETAQAEATAPQDAAKEEPVKDVTPVEEIPTRPDPVAETPVEEPKLTITHDMIQQKVKELIAHGTPEQNAGARKAVTSRARNISGLSADVLADVWADLIALEA